MQHFPGRDTRSRAGASVPTSQWCQEWSSSSHGTTVGQHPGILSKIFNTAESCYDGKSALLGSLVAALDLLCPVTGWTRALTLWIGDTIPDYIIFGLSKVTWHIYKYIHILEQRGRSCYSRRLDMIYGAILKNYCDIQCHKTCRHRTSHYASLAQ